MKTVKERYSKAMSQVAQVNNALAEISRMPCTGSYVPIGGKERIGCGRCATCKARKALGIEKIPHGGHVVCHSCGYTQ